MTSKSSIASTKTLLLSSLLWSHSAGCYHAEVIYHGRAHGRTSTPAPEALDAKRHIRNIVDRVITLLPPNGRLDPAYMWPLFLYAVERTTRDGVGWAIDKLHLVNDPLWSTDFIKNFVGQLSSEQLQRGERVDSRYFCVEKYGNPPPFICASSSSTGKSSNNLQRPSA
jgi:hypothetical protein